MFDPSKRKYRRRSASNGFLGQMLKLSVVEITLCVYKVLKHYLFFSVSVNSGRTSTSILKKNKLLLIIIFISVTLRL